MRRLLSFAFLTASILSFGKGECLLYPMKLLRQKPHKATVHEEVKPKGNPVVSINPTHDPPPTSIPEESKNVTLEIVDSPALSPELEDSPTLIVVDIGDNSEDSQAPEEVKQNTEDISHRIAALELAIQSMKNPASTTSETSREFQNPYPVVKRISGAFRTRGPGYNSDYGTLSTLITSDYQRGKAFPMFDMRANFLLDGQWAGNFGVGFRIVPHHGCMIFGANIFYDFRSTDRGNFNQFGLGFELLSQRWGLHFNGYLPFAGSKHGKKHIYDDYEGPYEATCFSSEYAFDSFNLGMDLQIFHIDPFLIFGELSPYYVSSTHHGQHSLGIRVGIRPQYSDYFAIDLNVSHDNVFGTIFQAAAILTFPLYHFGKQKNQTGPCGLTNRVIYQPIQRDEIIKIKNFCCRYHTNY